MRSGPAVRVVAAVAVLALLGVTLTGLVLVRSLDSGDGSAGRTPPAPRASEQMPTPGRGLDDFYAQRLDWSTCGDHECARLEVPLDYADPGGETIGLAVLRVPARRPDERVGSLVVNPGGPGASGTAYAARARDVFGRDVLDYFDIVGIDPRGVGDSAAVDCLPDADLDAWLAADPDPDTPAELRDFQRGSRALADGCVARSGALAAHVSTVEAARDLDVLRAALEAPLLDYFGASYGTRLGATYAQLFPEQVGRMVLDGAVDLRSSARQLALQQAHGFETALRAYVANCVEGADGCFLGGSVDAGVARIQRFLRELDAEPLSAADGRELTEGLAVLGIITPLYSRDYWLLLSAGLRQALAGDPTSLLLLADAYASRGPDGYLDNTVEANYVINCLDDPSAVTLARARREVPAFERVSPTFGRIFAFGQTGCTGFTPRATEPPPDNRAPGAPPMLVIGTTRDPATPMRWAEAMARQLSSAVLVRRDGDGHTGYGAGNACVDSAVEDFLLDGTVPADDLSC